MKFTNGNWLMKKGIVPVYVEDIFESEIIGDRLKILGCSTAFSDRSTFGDVALTIDVDSPMDDVIRVKLTHFKGVLKKGPYYAIRENKGEVEAYEAEDAIYYRSHDLTLKIKKNPGYLGWKFSFLHDNKELVSSDSRSMAYFKDENTNKNYVSQQLSLDVNEKVYGLGERFTPFVKNGQVVEMWQADGGTSSEQAYKNIPFYITNKGYGVFVNSTKDVAFEIASEKVERVCFSQEGEDLEYMIIYGKTPADILEKYTSLTGKPALPPAWSFGLWLSTSFTTNYDEETVTSFINGMKERHIPLHVFHFDCYWMKGNHWVDFSWDPLTFPNPEEMIARYKERGLHICVWLNPYIAQASSLFDEAMENGYLIKKTDGSVWQTDLWQPQMGIVDFTNPKAKKWYQDHLRRLMDMGVDSFKTDFGERIPVRDIAYYDGSDALKMHNYYTQIYNEAVFEVLEEKRGKHEAVVFARSATVGGQSLPVHWAGDNTATYPSMAETLRAGLSLALCGFGFWSHDIGGFEETAPADVYKRWVQFGLLSTHSRLHGSKSYRVPWNFDEEASVVLRKFVELKCRLMPYVYHHAIVSHERGIPVLRPMMFEFYKDLVCDNLDLQYMLGDKLLVAPVFKESGECSFYLPEGRWTDFFTDEVYEGGRYYTNTYDFMTLPLFVRENTVLPLGANDQRPDYDYMDGLTLKIYELKDETSIKIPNIQGEYDASFSVKKKEGRIIIDSDVEVDNIYVEYQQKRYAMKGRTLEIVL